MRKKKTKSAIFLGAGASASEGAPIQMNLFRDYFKLLKTRLISYSEHEEQLAKFFDLMFNINVKSDDLDKAIFPTFEEALGILDLADLKNESFKDFPNINFASDSGKIKFLRLYLVFLMADIINDSLSKGFGIHRKLIDNLNTLNLIDDSIFITTNYDILCDNALLDLFELGKKVDYGVDFVNFKERTFLRPNLNSIKFFKLHGSLNWLYCPTCNNLRITPYEKGVYNLMVDPLSALCKICQTVYSPIIVPPTFYKDLSRVFLNEIWNKTENELLFTEHIIFCGYSFPDADIHIKYLLKRIQKNRQEGYSLKFTIVNNHPGKKDEIKKEEGYRFKRFLGNNVNYTNISFEQFANDPEIILK